MSIYVLVHGSYQGGWIWKPTAQRLRDAGHTVYTPTLDGCGERSSQIRPGITIATQAREVADLMFYEDLRDCSPGRDEHGRPGGLQDRGARTGAYQPPRVC